MRQIRRAILVPIAVVLLACVGCGSEYSASEPAPPPYAPAYGYSYREPYDHVLLIYDPDLVMYRVSGYNDVYFRNGQYYRLRNDNWYCASRFRGHWAPIGYGSIPPGLQHKYNAPVKYKSQNSASAKSNAKEPGMHAKKHYKRGKSGG